MRDGNGGAGSRDEQGAPIAANLLDVLHDAVYSVSADRRILTWNAAAERIYGYQAAEVIGQRVDETLAARFPGGETIDDVYREMDRTGHIRREVVQRRRDGGDIFVEGEAVAIRGSDGCLSGYVIVNRDVTERRRAEEQRKQLEAQLAFADRMASIGTLAAGVAHEINNPLAFMLSNLGYVAEELARVPGVPPDVLSAVAETREGAVRVGEIVRDLKTVSRADDRSGDAPVDVRTLLQSSINLTQAQIRRRARLSVDLRDVQPVTASAPRLGQVFVNLLINAAHAIPDGHPERNEIRVRCAPGDGASVVIEVSDTGGGIAPEHLPHIFEPFFTTRAFGTSTGMGLSICHGTVTRLGGRIDVETELGRGSTFRVWLPC